MKFLVSHLELKDRTYYVMYTFWWIYELSGCGFKSSCSHLIFLSVDGKSTAVFNLDWYKLQLTAQLRNAEYKKLVRQTCIACSLEFALLVWSVGSSMWTTWHYDCHDCQQSLVQDYLTRPVQQNWPRLTTVLKILVSIRLGR